MFVLLQQRIFALFFFLGLLGASAAELQPGSVAHLKFRDVDGNEHATDKGFVTVIAVVTREEEAKAQAIADRVPNRCMGDPKYKYVTVVNFQRKIFGPLQGLTKAFIRNRLNAEAERIRPDYRAKKLTRDPRQDILVVADFDGSEVGQLGLSPDSNAVGVFVFNGRGKLIARWNDVPPEGALPRAISAAE